MLQKGKEGYQLHIEIWCMSMKCWFIDMLESIDLLQWYVPTVNNKLTSKFYLLRLNDNLILCIYYLSYSFN